MSTGAAPPFGLLLKRHRAAARLTQQELSERAHLSVDAVSALERGVNRRPHKDTVALLAEALVLTDDDRAAFMAAARPPDRRAHLLVDTALRPAPPSNLPLALTSFIGREQELATAQQLLHESRLVTLTGAGGCGKTRLALQVARSLLAEYHDGIWLVELASLTSPDLVPQAVTTMLGLPEQPGRPHLAVLTDFLATKRLLLVLDNCEHLVGACAELATVLLQNCSHLRILATSREGLEVAGETIYLVPSLEVPDPWQVLPPEELLEFAAVRLFVERARARRGDFVLSSHNAAATVQICHRLDGIPMAIELAAARIDTLPVEGIAARLEDCFHLLTGGPRTALPRQQTLRATLDWSYGLLVPQEQILLARLSAFAGGWTLEAAEVVCADAPSAALPDTARGIEGGAVMDLLGGLVRKSLALLEERAGAARYRLLETVRQYAEEKLERAGDGAAVHARHLAWCVALAEEAEPHLTESQQGGWLARLEREHDNLRLALRRSLLDGGDMATGARLGAALGRFWSMQNHLSAERRWLEIVVTSEGVPPLARARARYWLGIQARFDGDDRKARSLFESSLAALRELAAGPDLALALNALASVTADPGRAESLLEEALAVSCHEGYERGAVLARGHLGRMAAARGDYDRARAMVEEGVAQQRAHGDRQEVAAGLMQLGLLGLWQSDFDRARASFAESLTLLREIGNTADLPMPLYGLGVLARARGDDRHARMLYDESLALAREHGDRWHVIYALLGLAQLARDQGDDGEAGTLQEEGLRLARELGNPIPLGEALNELGLSAVLQRAHRRARALLTEALNLHRDRGLKRGVAIAQYNLGRLAHEEGDPQQAQALLAESLILRRAMGEKLGIAECLEGLAGTAGARGQAERSAALCGAAEALREAIDAPLPPSERARYERVRGSTSAVLGAEGFAGACATGRALPLEAAIALALEAGPVG